MERVLRLWPLVLIIVGVVLLLDSFLLINLKLSVLWPLVIVLVGVQLLLRGDVGLSWQAQTFGITRGSVQSASLEVESGEVDVQVRALRKPGRLIAGQYTSRSRPALSVRNNHAALKLRRGQTWWPSLADWDLGLALDLPWGVLISSFLGQLDVDLRGLQVERAYLSSGLGSVTLACPDYVPGPIFARSTFGDVRLSLPPDSRAAIRIKAGPFGRVRADQARYVEVEPGLYRTIESDETPDQETIDLDITASTVFGSIYLS
ncbi:MAG: DUF4097 domain-containing protein [Chloroflexi bacterium]|nr:DUF4097 domain-containing protein [Chloroflexota bacterium]